MLKIPAHVITPGDTSKFIPESVCRQLQSAGLGYTIMKALGAREGLSTASIKVIQEWCRKHCGQYPDVVPDDRRLKKASFEDRLYRPREKALENAICYPGAPSKPSYQELYQMVWIEQKWPELCRAMCNMP